MNKYIYVLFLVRYYNVFFLFLLLLNGGYILINYKVCMLGLGLRNKCIILLEE